MPRPRDTTDPRSGPSAETADTVLTAAFQLLVNEGITALTPSRLHQETGVARTTIYRHWPEASDLVADLLAGATRRDDLGSYTGDLEHDLRVAVGTLTFRFANRPLRAMLGALVGIDRHSEHAASVGQEYVEGLLAPIREVVVAGVDSGAIVPDASVAEMVAELAGPLMLRHVFLGEQLPEDQVEAAIVRFLDRYRA